MAKPDLQFFRPDDLPWGPVAGSTAAGAGGPGVTEKILSRDPATGNVTRLLRFEPGVETSATIAHDFREEVWILAGSLIDLGKTQTFGAGMYARRSPGMLHRPYRSPGGALLFGDPLPAGSRACNESRRHPGGDPGVEGQLTGRTLQRPRTWRCELSGRPRGER